MSNQTPEDRVRDAISRVNKSVIEVPPVFAIHPAEYDAALRRLGRPEGSHLTEADYLGSFVMVGES